MPRLALQGGYSNVFDRGGAFQLALEGVRRAADQRRPRFWLTWK